MTLTPAADYHDFLIVPSLTNCCFGLPPGVEHTIAVLSTKSIPSSLMGRLVTVDGTLRVHETRQDGYTTNIFEIQNATAKAYLER